MSLLQILDTQARLTNSLHQTTSQAHKGNHNQQDMGPIHKSLGDMVEVVEKIHTTMTKYIESIKPGWGRLDDGKQRMLLRFSSKNGTTWPLQPSQSLCTILSQQTAPDANEFAKQSLQQQILEQVYHQT